ncbi:MAG: hypothetical protein HY300_10590, partial [Verrucomicrobia bacterium]|nr:hypothetical protein [Verrucomicrobiota bacterium]
MAKNRKNDASEVRLGTVAKALLLCLFIGGSGAGYVWNKNQLYSLGQQIKLSETRLAELRRQNKLRSDQLALLKSPPVLEQRVKDLKLGLGPPAPEQVVTLNETVPGPLPALPAATAEKKLPA